MATIKQIAELAGVSRGTVDRALNHRGGISEDTAEEIRRLAAELSYTPNLAGRLLASRKKELRLAFISFGGPEYIFFEDVRAGAEQKAEELRAFGVTVLFYCITEFSRENFERVFAQIEADHVDGISTTPMKFSLFNDFMLRMAAKNVPFVFYNMDDPAVPTPRLCYVGCDYVRAGRVAAGLTALCVGGAGKVGILTHRDSDNQSYTDRAEGFTSELAAHYPEISLLDGSRPTVFRHDDYASVRALIAAHPELGALYIVNMGDFSVCEVAREAAGARRLAIITNDLVPVQRQMLQGGVISATLGQQPEVQGGQPLQILYEFLSFGVRPERENLFTDLDIHISQNV